jgi:hypothetical protein
MIRFACPACKAVLECPDDEAGCKMACPKCSQRLQIPTPPPDKTRLAPLVEHVPDPASRSGASGPAPAPDPNSIPVLTPDWLEGASPASGGQSAPPPPHAGRTAPGPGAAALPPSFGGQPPAPTASGTTQFNCPHCHSTQTIKVSLVYERETVHSQSAGVFTGIGVSRRGTGVLLGTSQQSTLHQTAMAKRLQPPQQARLSAGLKWAFAGMILLGLAGLGRFVQATDSRSGKSPAESVLALTYLGGAGLCAFAFVRGKQQVEKWNAEGYPRKMAAWEASWLCQRCGTTFVAWKAKSRWESGA